MVQGLLIGPLLQGRGVQGSMGFRRHAIQAQGRVGPCRGLVESIAVCVDEGQVGRMMRALQAEIVEDDGMTEAFDGTLADFSGMNGKKELFINEVIHQAVVDVDEEGTEAAAATAVVMGVLSAPSKRPIVVKIDRPFVFLIRDIETGAILFLGRVLDPST